MSTQRMFAGIALVLLFITVPAVILLGKSEDERIIRLGSVLSFQGRYQTNGMNTYNGYELAVKRINDGGGIKINGRFHTIEIVYYDDQSDPTLATELSERLIKQDGIRYMLGPYSSEMTKHVAQVTRNYNVPLVEAEGAALSLFEQGNQYIFGLLSTCDNYLSDVIELAVFNAEKEGKAVEDLTLSIAVQNDRFSMCIREAVLEDANRFGIKLIIDGRFALTEESISGILKDVERSRPDILVISGHSLGAEIATRLIANMDIDVPFIAITHCEAARIIERFGEAAEGFYCPAQWTETVPYCDDLFGSPMEFAEALKQANPDSNYSDIPYQSASAAAAVLVWKDAFERANSLDTETLRDALAATDLMTFYGRIKFGPKGQIISKPMVLRQVRGGQLVEAPPVQTEPLRQQIDCPKST